MPMRALTLALFVALAPLAAKPAQAAPADDAAALVADGAERLLEILELDAGAERRRAFRGWLDETFHLDAMARFALGPYREQASEAQRREFRDAFSDYLAIVVEARFDDFVGARFSIARARVLNEKIVIVRSAITPPGGGDIIADFRVMRLDDGRLLVVDVAVEGLSMLRTQRDEMTSIIRRDGLGGAIASLRARSAEITAGAE